MKQNDGIAMIYDIPFAESFKYTTSGRTERQLFDYPFYRYEYDSIGSLWSYRRDSVYKSDFVRFVPNNFYEATWTERFTLTETGWKPAIHADFQTTPISIFVL
ncbi:MAG: hypothetical protein IPM77_04340 [Crocinitomicaceae bacterium]|nr:hypothetical protein [Crocinitomicaceae bacterium]